MPRRERPPLGVCTWTFGDRPLVEIAATVAACGYDGLELFGDVVRYTPAAAGAIAADHGLRIYSLTPPDADLSHPDAATRRAAVDVYRRLLDFAAALAAGATPPPLVSCHGLVGRSAPLATQAEEDAWLVTSVRAIAAAAAERGVRVVFEVLNRYETHQVCTAAAALRLLDAVAAPNLGVLLDAYHMNIEEPNPATAIAAAGSRLWLYHVADSNREALGNGHIDFGAQARALAAVGYAGPIIVECTARGPNPFTPIKDGAWEQQLTAFLGQTRAVIEHTYAALPEDGGGIDV